MIQPVMAAAKLYLFISAVIVFARLYHLWPSFCHSVQIPPELRN